MNVIALLCLCCHYKDIQSPSERSRNNTKEYFQLNYFERNTIFVSMFKQLFYFFCFLALYSCSSNETNGNGSNEKEKGVEVRIIKEMGEMYSDTIRYLPLIGSIAEVKESGDFSNHLVIGKNLEKGDNIEVRYLSTLVFKHGESIHKLDLSIPISEKYQSLEVQNFNELAAKYGSVKWAIENWYNHFAGLGKSRFLGWEPISYQPDLEN